MILDRRCHLRSRRKGHDCCFQTMPQLEPDRDVTLHVDELQEGKVCQLRVRDAGRISADEETSRYGGIGLKLSSQDWLKRPHHAKESVQIRCLFSEIS